MPNFSFTGDVALWNFLLILIHTKCNNPTLSVSDLKITLAVFNYDLMPPLVSPVQWAIERTCVPYLEVLKKRACVGVCEPQH